MTERDDNGRFLPGTCGNPKGRPRKRALASADINAVLVRPVVTRDNKGAIKMVAFPIAHIMKLQEAALKGDMRAGRELLKLDQQAGLFDKMKWEQDSEAYGEKLQQMIVAKLEEQHRKVKEYNEEVVNKYKTQKK